MKKTGESRARPFFLVAAIALLIMLVVARILWKDNEFATDTGNPDSSVALRQPSRGAGHRKPTLASSSSMPEPELPRPVAPADLATSRPSSVSLAQNAIEELRSNFFGKDLETELWVLGNEFGSKGIDAVRDFILHVPPGIIGDSALAGLMVGVDPNIASEVFNLLQASKDHLREHQVTRASSNLFHSWGNKDFEAAWSFALSLEQSGKGKTEYLDMALWGADPNRVVAVVGAVSDPDLKNKLASSTVSILGHLKAGDQGILYQNIATKPADKALQVAFAEAMRTAGDYSGTLSTLHSTDYAGKNELITAAMADWVGSDTNHALEFLLEIDDEQLTSRVIEQNYRKIALYDRESALTWASRIQDQGIRDRVLRELSK